jgi:hypothetical protein
MSDNEQATGRGKIGEQIFEQVEALMRAESITRTEAFQRIAVTRGSRAGTVAANYYRIARLKGDGILRPRGRKKSTGNEVEAVIARATSALGDRAELVRHHGAELDRLSEKVHQIEKLRALLSE